jgi:hypothetical protein
VAGPSLVQQGFDPLQIDHWSSLHRYDDTTWAQR